MAAIDTALFAREAVNTLARRNWPAENAGVMVVFCIVFIVACAIIGTSIAKCLARRKEKQTPKY
ncbi:hypothetical protein E4U42_001665 [Claviceps africana]|uniref:Uncharacterized protein n=1 Tax=Claviceps africana TaxID=83212 RepID=A0A8K0JBK3_9HYPO|nr:hypothetical protein E4U42_001665 [Claviceps africana]